MLASGLELPAIPSSEWGKDPTCRAPDLNSVVLGRCVQLLEYQCLCNVVSFAVYVIY